MKFAFLVLFSALSYTTAFSMPNAPRAASIYNPQENSSLAFECNGKPPYNEIDCKFSQTSISKKDDKYFLDKAKEIDSAKEFDLKKSFEMCSKMDQHKIEFQKQMQGTSESKRMKIKQELDFYTSICKCKDEKSFLKDNSASCVKDLFKKHLDSERNICTISTNSFELSFKRVNQNKWISNPGPVGICNVVNVAFLEKDPKGDYLWTYSQTRVSIDDSDICKGLELNKPVTFSWLAPNDSALKCEAIKFGL